MGEPRPPGPLAGALLLLEAGLGLATGALGVLGLLGGFEGWAYLALGALAALALAHLARRNLRREIELHPPTAGPTVSLAPPVPVAPPVPRYDRAGERPAPRPPMAPLRRPPSPGQGASACHSCGSPLPPGSRFCYRCGRPIAP